MKERMVKEVNKHLAFRQFCVDSGWGEYLERIDTQLDGMLKMLVAATGSEFKIVDGCIVER